MTVPTAVELAARLLVLAELHKQPAISLGIPLHEYVRKPEIDILEQAADKITRQSEKIHALEGLRPVWAQGWTDESIAAQASATALAQIWALLGAIHQTDAMEKLRTLIANQKE